MKHHKMPLIEKLYVSACLLVIFCGGFYLYWYYQLDGVTMNPVVTYNVDKDNMRLTKTNWKRGETVTYYSSFCKHRDAVASMQWTLSNGVLTIYPERSARSVGIGCYPVTPNTVFVAESEEIPHTAELGCDHFFSQVIRRDIGGGRIRVDETKTEKFCVVE